MKSAYHPLLAIVLLSHLPFHQASGDDQQRKEPFFLERATITYEEDGFNNAYQEVAYPVEKGNLMRNRAKRFTYDFDDSSLDDKVLKINFRIRFF